VGDKILRNIILLKYKKYILSLLFQVSMRWQWHAISIPAIFPPWCGATSETFS